MVARNRARYLAPIALAATIAATVLVVRGAVSQGHPAASPGLAVTAARTSRAPKRLPLFYVVKSGDSMTSIAAKTGVPLGTIQALNPSVDPNTLQTGQKLRLRR